MSMNIEAGKVDGNYKRAGSKLCFVVSDEINKYTRFASKDKEDLLNDGAKIYLLRRETLAEQIQGQRAICVANPLLEHSERCGFRFCDGVSSGNMEVAIYPTSEKLFIHGTFNRTMGEQMALIENDTKTLRKKFNSENIVQILPEAPEIIQVMSKYSKEVGSICISKDEIKGAIRSSEIWGKIWCGIWSRIESKSKFRGRLIRNILDNYSIRTATRTDTDGSYSAITIDSNLLVSARPYFERSAYLGALCWIVPTGTK